MIVIEILILLAGGGGLLIGIIMCLVVMARKRKFLKMAEDFECKICGSRFGDSMIEYMGRISKTDRDRLDKFQNRFAKYKIKCHECESINICAGDGTPFKGLVIND